MTLSTLIQKGGLARVASGAKGAGFYDAELYDAELFELHVRKAVDEASVLPYSKTLFSIDRCRKIRNIEQPVASEFTGVRRRVATTMEPAGTL